MKTNLQPAPTVLATVALALTLGACHNPSGPHGGTASTPGGPAAGTLA